MAAPHWLEVHTGYENSPRHVRVFWRTAGVVMACAVLPAAFWLGAICLKGLGEGLRWGWQASPWGTMAAAGVAWLAWGLRRRLPP